MPSYLTHFWDLVTEQELARQSLHRIYNLHRFPADVRNFLYGRSVLQENNDMKETDFYSMKECKKKIIYLPLVM